MDRHKRELQSRPAEERLESQFQSDDTSSQRGIGSAVAETTEVGLDVGEGSGGEEGKATKLAATEAKVCDVASYPRDIIFSVVYFG